MVAHFAINSLINKFDSLIGQVTVNIDILIVSETKPGESFQISQFIIEGFSIPYTVDGNVNCGGIMSFVREANLQNMFLLKILQHRIFLLI